MDIEMLRSDLNTLYNKDSDQKQVADLERVVPVTDQTIVTIQKIFCARETLVDFQRRRNYIHRARE
jgi:hypothetical protein